MCLGGQWGISTKFGPPSINAMHSSACHSGPGLCALHQAPNAVHNASVKAPFKRLACPLLEGEGLQDAMVTCKACALPRMPLRISVVVFERAARVETHAVSRGGRMCTPGQPQGL